MIVHFENEQSKFSRYLAPKHEMQPQIAAQGRLYGGIWSVGPESVIDLHAHFMYTSAEFVFYI